MWSFQVHFLIFKDWIIDYFDFLSRGHYTQASFELWKLIITLVYLDFYGLILVFILFGIFFGMRRHEDGCILKCITMVLNPISDICHVCEVSKITLHSVHMILCFVMINGDYLNHDKWTILRWASKDYIWRT